MHLFTNLETLKRQLCSESVEERVKAVYVIGSLCTHRHNYPGVLTMEGIADLVPVVAEYARNPRTDEELRLLSARASVELVKHSSQSATIVVKNNGISAFVSLCKSPDPALVMRGLLGLIALINERFEFINLILKETSVPEIYKLLSFSAESTLVGCVVSCLGSFFNQSFPLDVVLKPIASLVRLLQSQTEINSLNYTVHALGQICKMGETHKRAAVEASLRVRLVDLLDHPDANLVYNVLQVLSLTDSKIRTCGETVRCGVLRKYSKLLQSDRVDIRRAVCRNLSILGVHIQKLIEAGILVKLVHLMKHESDHIVRNHATFTATFAALGTSNHIKYVVELDFIPALAETLKTASEDIFVYSSVEALYKILLAGDAFVKRGVFPSPNPYIAKVRDAGVLPKIRSLRSHRVSQIEDACNDVLAFFDAPSRTRR